jgi:hypothetical protein
MPKSRNNETDMQCAGRSFLRDFSTGGLLKPKADDLMSHILKCLCVVIKNEDRHVGISQKSERSKMFSAALGMVSNLAACGVLRWTIDLELTQLSSENEGSSLNRTDIKQLQLEGVSIGEILPFEETGSCFWTPLYFSAIHNSLPGRDICSDIRLLHEEYSNLRDGGFCDHGLLCMEILLKSGRITDMTRLHILRVLLGCSSFRTLTANTLFITPHIESAV